MGRKQKVFLRIANKEDYIYKGQEGGFTFEQIVKDIESIEQLEGLDYKIAYYRIVEGLTHKEIANELGYTEQYIRERWSKLKTYKQPTHQGV